MTPLEALLELLERVGASRGAAALVSEEELSRLPVEARGTQTEYTSLARKLAEGIPGIEAAPPGDVRRLVLAANCQDGYCQGPQC
jgi:hypothetical protein